MKGEEGELRKMDSEYVVVLPLGNDRYDVVFDDHIFTDTSKVWVEKMTNPVTRLEKILWGHGR